MNTTVLSLHCAKCDKPITDSLITSSDGSGKVWHLECSPSWALPGSFSRVSPSEGGTTDRELLVQCFERILEDWRRIDGEWGPTDGGLEGAIARGEETLIPKLRAALAARR